MRVLASLAALVKVTTFFLPLPMWLGVSAVIGAFLLGTMRLFNAYRRHATARRFQRLAPARAVADQGEPQRESSAPS